MANSIQRNLGALRLRARGKRFWEGSRALARRFAQLQIELAPEAGHFLIPLVSLNDALHQAVTNHIAIVEIYEADAFDAAQYVYGIRQTAALTRWQIDLGQITSDDHLGIEALSREHHLHLLGGAVLGFVQDDEAVV